MHYQNERGKGKTLKYSLQRKQTEIVKKCLYLTIINRKNQQKILYSQKLCLSSHRQIKTKEDRAMTTIVLRQRKVKTFKEVSVQMERIVTLYYKGYGSERMFHICEDIYFREYHKNGGY